MKKSTKVILGIILLVVFILIVYSSVKGSDGGKYNAFAQCLTDGGVKMYGAYWCPHCQNQKKMFGSSWDNINYIECSLPNRAGQTDVCIAAEIQSYPTWEFADGSRAQGELTFEDLSLRSGCALPAE